MSSSLREAEASDTYYQMQNSHTKKTASLRRVKIDIPQKNSHLVVEAGTHLMSCLIAAGIPVASSCGGDGVCGKCRVRILSHPENIVSHKEQLKRSSTQTFQLKDDERLSCQSLVQGDITIAASYW